MAASSVSALLPKSFFAIAISGFVTLTFFGIFISFVKMLYKVGLVGLTGILLGASIMAPIPANLGYTSGPT